jgi:hypothetical protein
MLQNCVMDEVFAKVNREEHLFPYSVLKPVYLSTVDGSLLRKAMIEILAYGSDPGDVEGSMTTAKCREWLTLEILQDVIKELESARHNKIPCGKSPKRGKCFFHVHGKDEHC